MSKEKALEVEINFLKTWIAMFAAGVFGIFGWMVSHYHTAGLLEIVIGAGLLLAFLLAILLLNRKVYRNLRELEELP